VSYDVWNYRDSASFAKIILTDQAEKKAVPQGVYEEANVPARG